MVYLDRVEAAWPLRSFPDRFARAGPLQRQLLMSLPARERRRILDILPFSYHTANTITHRRDLEAALKQIRRERLSTDNEEYLDERVRRRAEWRAKALPAWPYTPPPRA